MLAKYGLIVLTLVFGAVAFSAGMLASPSLKQDVIALYANVSQKLSEITTPLKSEIAKPIAAASSGSGQQTSTSAAGKTANTANPAIPTHAASSPATAASASASASTPYPAGSLMLTGAMAPSLTYTLQAAQFSLDKPATQLANSIQSQGVTSTVVLMSESQSRSWSVVTVGRFGSAEEALSQRHYYSTKLGLPPNMSAIALPPPAK
jgi:cell division septation protein DedD